MTPVLGAIGYYKALAKSPFRADSGKAPSVDAATPDLRATTGACWHRISINDLHRFDPNL